MPADRRRLAAREAELVRALHGGPPPPGLDERVIALTSAGIALKRARQVARTFPALARDLGTDYHETFARFARANPPRDGGALSDGLAFGTAVSRERRLSDDARLEHMVNRAAVVTRHGRLAPRRAPHLAATLTRNPPGLVVISRLPVLGTRVISLRAPQFGTAGS